MLIVQIALRMDDALALELGFQPAEAGVQRCF